MYAILCSSRDDREKGIEVLGLVDRSKTQASWWTGVDKDLLMVFLKEQEAEARLTRLNMNNPRVVPLEKARAMLDKQAAHLAAHEEIEQASCTGAPA